MGDHEEIKTGFMVFCERAEGFGFGFLAGYEANCPKSLRAYFVIGPVAMGAEYIMKGNENG